MRKALAVFLALTLAGSGWVSAAAATIRPQGPGFGARKAPNKSPLNGIGRIPSNLLETPLNLKPRELQLGQIKEVRGLEGAPSTSDSQVSPRRDPLPTMREKKGVGQALSAMVRNLEDSKEGEPQKAGQTLRSSFDGEKKADQQNSSDLPVPATEAEEPNFSKARFSANDSSALWENLKAWLSQGLSLRLPRKTKEWKERAARTLRKDPALALEKALADSFAETHGLSLERAQRAESLLNGDWQARLIDEQRTPALLVSGQKVYLPRDGRRGGVGLAVWSEKTGIRPLVEHKEGVNIFHLTEFNGDIYYSLDFKEIIRYSPSRGTATRIARTGNAKSARPGPDLSHELAGMAVFDGSLFIATHEGVFRLKKRARPGKNPLSRVGSIRNLQQLVAFKGRLYALTPYEISVLKGKTWERAFPQMNNVDRLFSAQGNLYAIGGGAISSIQGNQKVAEFWLRQAIYEISEVEGKVYAATSDGVYVRENGRWQRLPLRLKAKYICRIAPLGSGFVLGTSDGFFLVKHPGSLGENWRERLIKDIGRSIDAALREEKSRGSLESPDGRTGGSALETDDGRSLFSELARRAHLLLVAAVVWMLAAASSLAHLIGNMPLGHSEAPNDLWPKLELFFAEGLGLELKESRLDQLKREVSRVLKENPAKSLDQAVTEAFAAVYQLSSQGIRDAASLFQEKLSVEISESKPFRAILASNGKIVVGGNEGLYIRGANGNPSWSRLDSHRPYVDILVEFDGEIYYTADMNKIYRYNPERDETHRVAVINPLPRNAILDLKVFENKLFVATEEGILTFEAFEKKSFWRRLFESFTFQMSPLRQVGSLRNVKKLAVIDGKLYAVTANRFFILEGNIWKEALQDLPGAFLEGLYFAGNQIYATTPGDIYRYDAGSWSQELHVPDGLVREIAELNGKTYAATTRGVYIRENGRWRPEPWDVGSVLVLGAAGDTLLIGTLMGLFKISAPDTAFLGDDWRDRLLVDVGKTLDRESAEKSLPLLTGDDEKSILKGPDGRELFSGLQAGR